MNLRLSPTLTLPPEAITETFAILAARGAGKSNTAAKMAEQMHVAGLPFCIVDPVGSWWGLRSNREGTGPGLPIPIFGGPKGDVPLERGGGHLVADLVVDQRLSCVLDLRDLESEGGKKDFLLAFAQRLYRRNEQPLHLFLEEADDYIPQRPMRDEAMLLRAWENIVRRGRARGLGMTMITQRSASLNKHVLTQAQTLIAMRTTGPQDRAAIEEWLKYNDQSRDIIASLPSLADGEAWVWSPQFLRKTVRVTFSLRETFDSGATPKVTGLAKRPATLADIDLSGIKEKMAATIDRAKETDPKELRQKVAELSRKLDDSERLLALSMEKPAETKTVEVAVFRDGEVEALRDAAAMVYAALDRAGGRVRIATPQTAPAVPAIRRVLELDEPVDLPSTVQHYGRTALDAGQQRILDVAYDLTKRGIIPTREAIARWLGIHPNGGRYLRNLAALRAAGRMDGCTPLAVEAARPRTRGLQGAMAVLDSGKSRILAVIVDLHDFQAPVSRELLAGKLGIHPNGGRFLRNLAWLRQMGVITDRGPIEPMPGLFK